MGVADRLLALHRTIVLERARLPDGCSDTAAAAARSFEVTRASVIGAGAEVLLRFCGPEDVVVCRSDPKARGARQIHLRRGLESEGNPSKK